MSDSKRRAARKGPYYHILWKSVFFLIIIGVAASFYMASRQANYIWHWNRVPKYFYFEDTVEIRSEIPGEVASIKPSGEDSVIVVEGDGQSEQYHVPSNALLVTQGDTVYMGDVLGSYKEWRVGLLLVGLWLTVQVSAIAIVFGILLGLFTGLARISENPCLKWLAITYIEIIRGTPLLVQIMIWYFVVGTLINALLIRYGIPEIPSLWFGVASLAIFAGAYVAEIVRAGIQSVNRGQMEAARSLGMTRTQAMRKIILPQAFKRILPPLAGQFISLIKDSSLLGIIAIRELTKATREGVTSSLMPYELWFVCGVLYLTMTFALSMFVQYLERRTVS
ncbi:amino acid ABC transporter permease [Salidesulfovibrio brasiliensis]|uniref:amino acid ABC transporter permease n=1 Tax=Salidesulfovibrio brasiliensis TaxID=221711 RepID=UPI0006CF8D5E|nr:amino acid ABC transporter permease [Salidesulfovibrio brasiliensis]